MLRRWTSAILAIAMIVSLTVWGQGKASAADGTTNSLSVKNGSAQWKNVAQTVTGATYTDYTASFWMKGEGSVVLRIMDGSWSHSYTEANFYATDEWRQYTLHFNSMEYGSLLFDFYDSGTDDLYIDNAFLGEPGGPNLLTNPDFSAGLAGWSDVQGAGYYLLDTENGKTAPDPVPPIGFVDDLNSDSQMYDHSSNIRFDTSNGDYFNGDTGRLALDGDVSAGEAAYAIYHTDYDIQSFQIDSYYWDQQEDLTDILVSVSDDGDHYTPVMPDKDMIGGSWQRVLYSNYEMPVAGARYLKIQFPDRGELAESYAVELARITVNYSLPIVYATPPSKLIAEPTEIRLSAAWDGAEIHYSTTSDPTDNVYSGPFVVQPGDQVTAYSYKPGYEAGLSKSYSYFDTSKMKVDKYGQNISADFDTKVTSDQQLLDDVAADEAYYNSLNPPERDEYGGLPGSKDTYGLEATGFFHIEKMGDKFVMVDPLGNLYFSAGVTGVGYAGDTYTLVKNREYLYEWLPETAGEFSPAYMTNDNFSFYVANKIRKSGGQPFDGIDFYNETVDRLKKWGFTSAGAWSDNVDASLLDDKFFPQVGMIDLPTTPTINGSDNGSSMLDVFADNIGDAVHDALVARHVPENKDNSLLIGYFFGNELPWDSVKTSATSASAAGSATKAELVANLQEKYDDDIAKFNAAWKFDFDSFSDLTNADIPIQSNQANADMNDFLAHYADEFYKVLSAEFRELDSNHLLLGDRYLANTMNNQDLREIVSAEAGKYLDVLSYNYYTYDLDLERIKKMSELAGKPLMFTEFHYGEPTSGLTSAVRMVDDETEKGLAYRDYVEQAAASGVVVGTHWFEYLDQAATGRWFQGDNGEAFGVGLVNVADRPYKAMLNSVMDTNYHIYDVMLGNQAPYDYDFGPGRTERDTQNTVNIAKTDNPPVVDGLKDAAWPESGQLSLDGVNQVLGVPNADMKGTVDLAWDADNLYIYAHIHDSTPMQNAYKGGDIWNGDSLEMFVGPEDYDQPGAIRFSDTQIIISGQSGEPHWYNNRQDQPAFDTAVKLDEDRQGYSIEAAVPLDKLGLTDVGDGTKMRFDIGFDNGIGTGRVGQYMWNGSADNNQNRDKWGTATFVSGQQPSSGSSTVPVASEEPTAVNKETGEINPAKPKLDSVTGAAFTNIPADALGQVFETLDHAVVNIPPVEGATAYQVGIPSDMLTADNGSKTIEIRTETGTIIVPSDMLKGVELGDADTVTFVIAQSEVDDLPEAAAGKPVVDVHVMVNGKIMPWSNPEAPVTISIPYKPSDEELANIEHLTVWHIGDDGTIAPVPRAQYVEKTGSVTFATTHFSRYAVAFVMKTYEDLTRHEWARKAIETLASKGVISGVSETKYAPAANITRADFVTLLMKTLGLEAPAADEPFADVPAGQYYSQDVGAAQALGIIIGDGNHRFHPKRQINRQEMMTMTARALEHVKLLAEAKDGKAIQRFKDGGLVAKYAVTQVSALVDAGLIQGAYGYLNPLGAATRAEAAVFLYQVYRK